MTRHPDLPDDSDAAAINAHFRAGLIATTGFYDEYGNPAPWPDHLDEWRPSTDNPIRVSF